MLLLIKRCPQSPASPSIMIAMCAWFQWKDTRGLILVSASGFWVPKAVVVSERWVENADYFFQCPWYSWSQEYLHLQNKKTKLLDPRWGYIGDSHAMVVLTLKWCDSTCKTGVLMKEGLLLALVGEMLPSILWCMASFHHKGLFGSKGSKMLCTHCTAVGLLCSGETQLKNRE